MDYAATSPVYEEVVEAMVPFFTNQFGNPSSNYHPFGWVAKEEIEKCRKIVANLIYAKPEEIFFTSGATEAINWAHKGWYDLYKSEKPSLITQGTEHAAVLNSCDYLKLLGVDLTILSVDQNGKIEFSELENLLSQKGNFLLSIGSVNNETGIKQSNEKIRTLKEKFGFHFFCDATQSICKQEIDVRKLGCDLLAFSAHKFGGPKGCGVLYINERLRAKGFGSFIHGGFQESGLRAGTQNVPAIVGLRRAIELRSRFDASKIEQLKDRLETMLEIQFGATIIGKSVDRAPHISSIQIPGIDSEKFMMKINHKLAISNGAACNTAQVKPSHVLKAMGYSDNEIFSTLRFSLGPETTESEINLVIDILKEAL